MDSLLTEKRVKKIVTKKKRQFCKQDKGKWFPYEGEESEHYTHKINGVTNVEK